MAMRDRGINLRQFDRTRLIPFLSRPPCLLLSARPPSLSRLPDRAHLVDPRQRPRSASRTKGAKVRRQSARQAEFMVQQRAEAGGNARQMRPRHRSADAPSTDHEDHSLAIEMAHAHAELQFCMFACIADLQSADHTLRLQDCHIHDALDGTLLDTLSTPSGVCCMPPDSRRRHSAGMLHLATHPPRRRVVVRGASRQHRLSTPTRSSSSTSRRSLSASHAHADEVARTSRASQSLHRYAGRIIR
jgi:hypothetical protein